MSIQFRGRGLAQALEGFERVFLVSAQAVVAIATGDSAKRGQGFVDRRPNPQLLNIFVSVTIDAAGAGDPFPRNFGKPLLERPRQTTRRLGNDFEATRRCVKRLVVGAESVEVEAIDVEVEAIDEAHGARDVIAYVVQRLAVDFRKHRSHRRPLAGEGEASRLPGRSRPQVPETGWRRNPSIRRSRTSWRQRRGRGQREYRC